MGVALVVHSEQQQSAIAEDNAAGQEAVDDGPAGAAMPAADLLAPAVVAEAPLPGGRRSELAASEG